MSDSMSNQSASRNLFRIISAKSVRFGALAGFCPLVIAVLSASFTGCNADPGARREIQLLRAEILELEDRYYSLKSRCGDVADTNSTISADTYYCDDCGAWHEYGSTFNHSPSLEIAPGDTPIEITDPDSPEPIELDVPLDATQTGSRRPLNSSGQDYAGMLLDEIDHAGERELSTTLIDGESELRAHPVNNDDDPEPDGLMLSLPVDEQYIAPERLQVSLMDPSLSAGSQRLGLWEFDRVKVQRGVRSYRGKMEMRLFVPWNNAPEPGTPLVVFIRQETANGRFADISTDVAWNSTPSKSSFEKEQIAELKGVEPTSERQNSEKSSKNSRWRPQR
ncbi:MAG: hypothetical protein R3C03_11990 [Pirellulaceae bacterium]